MDLSMNGTRVVSRAKLVPSLGASFFYFQNLLLQDSKFSPIIKKRGMKNDGAIDLLERQICK